MTYARLLMHHLYHKLQVFQSKVLYITLASLWFYGTNKSAQTRNACNQTSRQLRKHSATKTETTCNTRTIKLMLYNVFSSILNKETINLASATYERTMISSLGDRRKAHVDLQDKVDSWIMELRLSDRGLKLFSDKDDQAKLSSYVIKSIGLQLINAIFTYATQDINPSSVNVSATKEFTSEMRAKLLSELSAEVREPLTKLNKCLAGNSVDEFLVATEPALSAVGLLSRKPDKKKEKQFLQTRRELLLSQLVQSDNPATVLLVGLLLMFQVATQNVLHATGKFVSIILPFLKPYLTCEVYQTLMKFQDLVIQLWSVDDNEEIENKLRSELNESMPQIKDICSKFRKPLQEKVSI